uniref:Protein EDS1B n=1 Tax=Noccaea caerulescens TaxID=107243 RepID=A0A1J3DS66_NOCCA
MASQALVGINNDLITRSWMASARAYGTEHFHKEEEGEVVFFSFRASFFEKDWFSPVSKSSFGEIKMKRDQFPCMRSIGNDVDATVNEAFLKNLEVLTSPRTSFRDFVKMVIDGRRHKRIVFTGHSSGGATAILATVWYLETYFKKQTSLPVPEPLCVTFGAPLVGDYVFKHALGRENWSRFFVNFVARFDIVPRIMLARKASTEKALPHVLCQLDPTRARIQENDQSTAEFYKTVVNDAATVAHQAVCELIGNGEAFLETLSSFLELSPYRPAGTFVFSTGTRLVSVNNSDAILQILFYASQSSNEHELSLVPYQSIRDHHSYEELVQSMGLRSFTHLDLHNLPLDGEPILSDLGLSTRARQCVRAAMEAEKKRVDNQSKVEAKRPKILKNLTWIEEEYKPRCRTLTNGYYDSFKVSLDRNDFLANVARADLAGIFDEVLGLVKKGQLPDDFEGSRDWIVLSTRYRRLIEPLDIANYHRHLKNEDTGPYMVKGRPNRYKHAQRVYEHERFKAGIEIEGSSCGSCFWAEVEELRGKPYGEVEVRVKGLERLLQGWINENEVDREQIFLEGSTFRKWWNSLPEDHKRYSPLRELMSETRAT